MSAPLTWLRTSLAAILAVPAAYGSEEQVPLAVESVLPSRVRAGGPDFIIRVSGDGFTQSTVLRWNGDARVTAVLSPRLLSAMVLACDLQKPGQGRISLFDPIKGQSEEFAVAVAQAPASRPANAANANPSPAIRGFSPDSILAGRAGLKILLRGEGFTPLSVVRWRGAARRTRYAGVGKLEADLLAEDLSAPGVAAVTVRTVHAVDGRSPDRPKIYPNPWRAEIHEGLRVSFENLARRSMIKIFATNGASVKTIPASAGAGEWDLTNEAGHPVSAGAYIYLITDGRKTVEGKLKVSR